MSPLFSNALGITLLLFVSSFITCGFGAIAFHLCVLYGLPSDMLEVSGSIIIVGLVLMLLSVIVGLILRAVDPVKKLVVEPKGEK